MTQPKEMFDRTFLDMRSRCLSLAADLDRIDRVLPGADDPRQNQLRAALGILLDAKPNRAERMLMIFSDQTPPLPHRRS